MFPGLRSVLCRSAQPLTQAGEELDDLQITIYLICARCAKVRFLWVKRRAPKLSVRKEPKKIGIYLVLPYRTGHLVRKPPIIMGG